MLHPNEHLQPVEWLLPESLVKCLTAQAAVEGTQPERLAARILAGCLGEQEQTAAGRCSLRTGLRSEGPMPLPMQQH